MRHDHSECAALFDFCECDGCVASRAPEPRNRCTSINTDEWYLWRIRSQNAGALSSHRRDMDRMGFTTGPIEMSRGWRESGLPPGWYYFSARIPKAALSVQDFKSLCAWDELHGELPNMKINDEIRKIKKEMIENDKRRGERDRVGLLRR